jgi:hypothetical protein
MQTESAGSRETGPISAGTGGLFTVLESVIQSSKPPTRLG